MSIEDELKKVGKRPINSGNLYLCLNLTQGNRRTNNFRAFRTGDPNLLLDYDPNIIFIFKDFLVMEELDCDINSENSLMETDAILYSLGLLSHYLIAHSENPLSSNFDSYIETPENPFEDLSDYGLIGGNYILNNGEKIDRAIMLDRTLKKAISPELVSKYPILNLIWKDGYFKSYSELMADKEALLQGITDNTPFDTLESPSYTIQATTKKENVEKLYGAIIQSDPMLYIESLLSQKQLSHITIKEQFKLHPQLAQEYKSQLSELFLRKQSEVDKSQEFIIQRISNELGITVPETIHVEEFVRGAIKNGARVETVDNAEKQLPSDFLSKYPQLCYYIPDDLISDQSFLALLEKYSGLFDYCSDEELESFVNKAEESYRKAKTKTSSNPTNGDVDIVDKTDGPTGPFDGRNIF